MNKAPNIGQHGNWKPKNIFFVVTLGGNLRSKSCWDWIAPSLDKLYFIMEKRIHVFAVARQKMKSQLICVKIHGVTLIIIEIGKHHRIWYFTATSCYSYTITVNFFFFIKDAWGCFLSEEIVLIYLMQR